MPATDEQLVEALTEVLGQRPAMKFFRDFGPERTAEFLCSLDPIFFMRHYVKIRSQPDAEDDMDERDDLEAEFDRNRHASSKIVYLDPWGKQIELIDALVEHHWVIAPKSRKIGFTTVGIGFGCWVQKYMPNTRIHYISRRDDAAINMLLRHKYSMRSLPKFMRMREVASSNHSFTVEGARGDHRVVQAYPATEDTAIEETADYTLLDEFASIREPTAGRLWAGLEPTIAPNGYVLIISRGKGPQGTFAQLVRRAAVETEGVIQ